MSSRPPSNARMRQQRARRRMAPGGLMWSESTIPRPAIRRIRKLEALAVCVALRPVIYYNAIWDSPPAYNVAPVTGGDDALRDDSDSTAAHLRMWTKTGTPSSNSWQTHARFAAVDVPDSFVPLSMFMLVRGREVGTIPPITGGTSGPYYYPFMTWQIAGGISTDVYDPYYMRARWHSHHSTISVPPMSAAYQTWDSRDNVAGGTSGSQPVYVNEIPSADAIRAGTIEGQFEVFNSASASLDDIYMDLAEVTLVICSDESGHTA